MSELFKTSTATVIKSSANRLIRVIDYMNPEVIWPKLLREYFLEVGYADLYQNFSSLRIGAVHPFAVLLFQEVSGSNLDLSVFPSITVTDTSENEVYDTLGRNFTQRMYGASDIALIQAGRDSKQFIISDSNLARLQTATANGQVVAGTRKTVRANHSVDLTIWCDNKDLTGIIYDMVRQFFMSNEDLHKMGFDIQDPISGRRSGDINVEFGKLLYGANITVSAVIETSTMVFDTEMDAIVNINAVADYHNP